MKRVYPLTILILTLGILLFLSFNTSTFALPFFNQIKKEKNRRNEIRICMLARMAVEEKIKNNKIISPPEDLPVFLRRPSGAFVTITKNGKTLGCMGTLEPHESNLAKEIIRSAILAATSDPWYPPIAVGDLQNLKYIVSIPGNLRSVKSPHELDPKNLGLLVRKEKRSALLLPGEAITPEWQVFQCKRKAGIKQNEKVEMFIFETVTFGPL